MDESYIGESQLARDPRVVLTDSVVNAVKQHLKYYSSPEFSPQAREFLRDSDDQWFVNYLESVLIAEDERGPFYEEFAKHKEAVESKLTQHKNDPKIFAKYAWVAGYHNFFCDLHRHHFSDEHKINYELFRATPNLIIDE